MGYQRDQSLPSEETSSTSFPEEPPPSYRPPLPPRNNDMLRAQTLPWAQQDPRTASTDSLVPTGAAHGRRTLLLIYIHGFMGDETSFQSFPAHVHNVVTPLLEQSHVVHTKIYPKYRSRKHITYARDAFSSWLTPHESSTTDVILCGHSMGGLLSAEVALVPDSPEGHGLRHRILGTLNFDVPFLGMHPGVVSAGLSSIFQPAAKGTGNGSSGEGSASAGLSTAAASEGSTISLQSPASGTSEISEKHRQSSSYGASSEAFASPLASPIHDPNYNPPFPNDVRLPVRKGWEGPLHFVKKHSNDLFKASKTYVTSHLEFGGAMVDYVALKKRYQAIRALEDVDDESTTRPISDSARRRVRFINYYTASTGRPKPPKPTPSSQQLTAPGSDATQPGDISSGASFSSQSLVSTPRVSVEAPNDGKDSSNQLTSIHDELTISESADGVLARKSEESDGSAAQPLTELHPEPEPADLEEIHPEPELTEQAELTQEPSLPPIPEEPTEPPALDVTQYEDKDSRKLAEKHHERLLKAYKQAVKDKERAIKERQKLVQKRERQRQKEQERQDKEDKKRFDRDAKERAKKEKAAATAASPPPETQATGGDTPAPLQDVATAELGRAGDDAAGHKKTKTKRDRKFCLLPPRRYHGDADTAWVRVFMKDVDEVGAHCGLFFDTYPHYEDLVLEAGQKVAEWVAHAEEVRSASSTAA